MNRPMAAATEPPYNEYRWLPEAFGRSYSKEDHKGLGEWFIDDSGTAKVICTFKARPTSSDPAAKDFKFYPGWVCATSADFLHLIGVIGTHTDTTRPSWIISFSSCVGAGQFFWERDWSEYQKLKRSSLLRIDAREVDPAAMDQGAEWLFEKIWNCYNGSSDEKTTSLLNEF